MASIQPRRSKQRTLPRNMPVMSERQTEAYLAARETLRRIKRSSALAYLTSDAVTIHWSGLQSRVDGNVGGAQS